MKGAVIIVACSNVQVVSLLTLVDETLSFASDVRAGFASGNIRMQFTKHFLVGAWLEYTHFFE